MSVAFGIGRIISTMTGWLRRSTWYVFRLATDNAVVKLGGRTIHTSRYHLQVHRTTQAAENEASVAPF
jgi:hypothetical protein